MLSSFLPPVPGLPSDPPEHFPLRKTGAWDRPAGTLQGKGGRALDEGQGGGAWLGGGQSAPGGILSGTAFSGVSQRGLGGRA